MFAIGFLGAACAAFIQETVRYFWARRDWNTEANWSPCDSSHPPQDRSDPLTLRKTGATEIPAPGSLLLPALFVLCQTLRLNTNSW